MSSLIPIPPVIEALYEIKEWRNALAILTAVHNDEWQDILKALSSFRLLKSDIIAAGGRKSEIAKKLDRYLYTRGWKEKKFDTKIVVDDKEYSTPTHKIDCYKNKVALEVEWNNKDTFFDRDLTNFRLLFELRAIDVGVIITRSDRLQKIFQALKKGSSYGASTTHMSKLIPRLDGGGGGGCPVLVFAIKETAYRED